jgi:hypothetical protein
LKSNLHGAEYCSELQAFQLHGNQPKTHQPASDSMSQLGLGYTEGPSNSAVAKNKHAPEMMINQRFCVRKIQHLQMKIPDANETGS